MEIGDTVGIYKTGTLASEAGFLGTGKIVEVTARLYRVKASKAQGIYGSDRRHLSGGYLRSSLVCRDGQPGSANLPMYSIVSIPPDRAEKIEQEIEAREEAEAKRRDEEETKKRQAAYEALPEAIKLARKLKWLCECNREEKIAQAPIHHLWGMIEWAKANQDGLKLELE